VAGKAPSTGHAVSGKPSRGGSARGAASAQRGPGRHHATGIHTPQAYRAEGIASAVRGQTVAGTGFGGHPSPAARALGGAGPSASAYLAASAGALVRLERQRLACQHSPPGSSARRSTARTPIGPRKAGGPHRNLSTL
jgi:hypothetical protein